MLARFLGQRAIAERNASGAGEGPNPGGPMPSTPPSPYYIAAALAVRVFDCLALGRPRYAEEAQQQLEQMGVTLDVSRLVERQLRQGDVRTRCPDTGRPASDCGDCKSACNRETPVSPAKLPEDADCRSCTFA